jgi:hypothetical protein
MPGHDLNGLYSSGQHLPVSSQNLLVIISDKNFLSSNIYFVNLIQRKSSLIHLTGMFRTK